MSGPLVVTFGEVMVLMLADPGPPLGHAGIFRRQIAGAEANVAVGLTRLGVRTRFIGRIGEGPLGDGILRALRAEGVDVDYVVRDPAPDGVIIRDFHGERPVEVSYHRAGSAGSRLRTGDITGNAFGDARLLHVTGITPTLSASAREATIAAVTDARAAGMTVSFDPNIRRRLAPVEAQIPQLRDLAAQSDLVFAGEDEARLIAGMSDLEAAARWFLQQGAALVVIKQGAGGSWATDGHRTWRQVAMPVTAVDPVGAGDAFAAGFLSRWLDGRATAEALAAGAALAAAVVQVPGDMDGLLDEGGLSAALAGVQEARR